MKIGIVLSKPPGYSETFFKSKIKGLKNNGYEPVLFCREYNSQFNLCPVRTQPHIYGSLLIQRFAVLLALLKLVPHIIRVIRFIRIERRLNESFTGIIKKIYLNSHILSAHVDWLHFGFGTLTIGSESVARAINAKWRLVSGDLIFQFTLLKTRTVTKIFGLLSIRYMSFPMIY